MRLCLRSHLPLAVACNTPHAGTRYRNSSTVTMFRTLPTISTIDSGIVVAEGRKIVYNHIGMPNVTCRKQLVLHHCAATFPLFPFYLLYCVPQILPLVPETKHPSHQVPVHSPTGLDFHHARQNYRHPADYQVHQLPPCTRVKSSRAGSLDRLTDWQDPQGPGGFL